MIVLLVALTVGWVLLSVSGALTDDRRAGLYWTLLSAGSVILILILVGTVLYLSLSIKAINLNRRQSNFIDSVTHELKSPIASLKLYVQTMHRCSMSPEEQKEFLRDMLEDVERLDNLVNHLLDAARLEKSPIDAEIEELGLMEILRDSALSVASRYRIPVESIRLQGDATRVRAQRVDLEMIFRNLLDNAVKYGGSPPEVQVNLHRNRLGRAIIRIADNGSGIPLTMRRKIFGRFERLGLELERSKPGTGLGLFIVRTLVQRLKGRIRIRDNDQAHGTVFEVDLPAEPVSHETHPLAKEAH
jgi:two-component system, OmpR family, phosphate regulon sensor histidine kinase PhoR